MYVIFIYRGSGISHYRSYSTKPTTPFDGIDCEQTKPDIMNLKFATKNGKYIHFQNSQKKKDQLHCKRVL
jgi:hypothetical protein